MRLESKTKTWESLINNFGFLDNLQLTIKSLFRLSTATMRDRFSFLIMTGCINSVAKFKLLIGQSLFYLTLSRRPMPSSLFIEFMDWGQPQQPPSKPPNSIHITQEWIRCMAMVHLLRLVSVRKTATKLAQRFGYKWQVYGCREELSQWLLNVQDTVSGLRICGRDGASMMVWTSLLHEVRWPLGWCVCALC